MWEEMLYRKSKLHLYLNQEQSGSEEMFVSISLLWLLAGLMVIYKIGIGEILTSMGLEAMASGEEEMDNPISLGICLFFVLLMWPLLWIEYNSGNN